MDPRAPTLHIEKTAQLRYLFAFPAARIFISCVDRLSQSKDVVLKLKDGIQNHGLVVVNLDQVVDAREIDYCFCAMEQFLEVLGEDEEGLGVDEKALETLEFFTHRFSAERSICDEEGVRAVVTAVRAVVRAVVTAVRAVVRAARSPRVEGDDAVGDLTRMVKGVFGVARAVTTSLFGVVRAARSPRVAVADLARAGRSPWVEGDDTMVGLARAALGEVRAARERPVKLDVGHLLLQVASVDGVAELLRTTPPRTLGVWSTVRVLNVRGLPRLSDAADVYHEVQRCCAVGWRVPELKKLGQARRLDSHFILLNHKLSFAFSRSTLREDGSVDFSKLKIIGKQGEEIVRLCTDEIDMFQSEVATLPDVLSEIVAGADECTSPQQAKVVRGMANKAMLIIRNLRAQQVRF